MLAKTAMAAFEAKVPMVEAAAASMVAVAETGDTEVSADAARGTVLAADDDALAKLHNAQAIPLRGSNAGMIASVVWEELSMVRVAALMRVEVAMTLAMTAAAKMAVEIAVGGTTTSSSGHEGDTCITAATQSAATALGALVVARGRLPSSSDAAETAGVALSELGCALVACNRGKGLLAARPALRAPVAESELLEADKALWVAAKSGDLASAQQLIWSTVGGPRWLQG